MNHQTTAQHPLIDPVPPQGDEARVAALLGIIEQELGFVPDGLRLYGISPPLLETFLGTVGYFRSGAGGLSPELATAELLPAQCRPQLLFAKRTSNA